MSQVCIADCNILKCSLLWQCVSSCVLCLQVATRLVYINIIKLVCYVYTELHGFIQTKAVLRADVKYIFPTTLPTCPRNGSSSILLPRDSTGNCCLLFYSCLYMFSTRVLTKTTTIIEVVLRDFRVQCVEVLSWKLPLLS